MAQQPHWPEPATGFPWWSEDRLAELLVDRGLTYQQAGRELGCHEDTVRKWAGRHGLLDEQ